MRPFGFKNGVLIFSAPKDPDFKDWTQKPIPTIKDIRREYAKKDRQRRWREAQNYQ